MAVSTTSHNTIQAYLDSPLVPDEEIKAAGGVLKYWELARATRPQVAQMALDLLSVPGQFTIISLCCHTNLISIPLLLPLSVDGDTHSHVDDCK